jgi:chorismate mutase
MSEITSLSSPPDAVPEALARLRAEIDSLDDRLHDLLMARAEIIERVAREGGKRGVPIRPGREAAMLRRLLARHHGALPPQTIVRIWRELFSGALMIEGGLTIAVADGAQTELPSVAREHFGPLTSLRRHRTTSQALADLTNGNAHAAVLPLPSDEDDEQSAWWVGLMHGGVPRLAIIAKLPFWTRRNEGVPQAGAYVVASLTPDPSGADRSLIGIEIAADTSTARIAGSLKDAGFEVGTILPRRATKREVGYALADVEGLVARDDPRLAAMTGFLATPVILGAYAVPLPSGAPQR